MRGNDTLPAATDGTFTGRSLGADTWSPASIYSNGLATQFLWTQHPPLSNLIVIQITKMGLSTSWGGYSTWDEIEQACDIEGFSGLSTACG